MTTIERKPTTTSEPPLAPDVTGPGVTSEAHRGRPKGIEVRVHGIGDHATYSALGKPRYREIVSSRVWIGQVPDLPPHQLRLVNWSRANRHLTRHLNWYLAFPFTLVNVAGYMEPTSPRPRSIVRGGVAVASLCLTIAMAAWITVILETVWHAVAFQDDRLTSVVLQAISPGVFILFILYRLTHDKETCGRLISVVTLAALAGMIVYLHSKPASRTDDMLHLRFFLGDLEILLEPMTTLIVVTTAVVWLVAIVLCLVALWNKADAAAFAGAALLLVIATTLLHAGGSMLRLFASTLLGFMPMRSEHISLHGVKPNVLLPRYDDFAAPDVVVARFGVALRIDFIPLFAATMLAVLVVIFWFALWRQPPTAPADHLPTKPPNRVHILVSSIPTRLPAAAIGVLFATPVVWVVLYGALAIAAPKALADTLIVLQVIAAGVILAVLGRRPERLAEQLRKTFGAIADIAGFWAPDLHPLAGASYRWPLIEGIRDAIDGLIRDFPDQPVALVGHSQGSVVCAWFMRGGHWTQRDTESDPDRKSYRNNAYRLAIPHSDRIALFTCGSPLQTLYQTFFPRYFGPAFFSKTTDMTYERSWWRNYWRSTDPIASPLPITPDSSNIDVTEALDEPTLGHSEYWKNEELRADIREFFNSVGAGRGTTQARRDAVV